MGYDPGQDINCRYYTVGYKVVGAIDDTLSTSAVNSGLNTQSPDDLVVTSGTPTTANAIHYLASKKVASNIVTVAS
jgi:hypothetical protein